jgi:predicted dehydrogenase
VAKKKFQRVGRAAVDRIGVGLIGTGYMGKCHAMAWNGVKTVYGDVPRPQLVGLCDIPREAASARAAEFGFAYGTSDWRRLIDDPAIDVVSITVPNHLHAEMAIAALERGKHVWCEKPMAPTLADAIAMADAAAAAAKTAVLGYNYIQNPAIRHARRLLDERAIGPINHVRIEMDEDFLADPTADFTWRSQAQAGYGALDDFGVHPLSLLWTLFGALPSALFGEMARPYPTRPLDGGTKVENWDIATALLRYEGNLTATIQMNRAAWGRKGRIFLQIFGADGAILFDQERMNEIMLYRHEGDGANAGFRTILAGPSHPPYERFIKAAGHQLGFNDLKIIECRQLIGRIRGEPAVAISFAEGVLIERQVHAIATSYREGRWVGFAAEASKVDPLPGLP